MFWKKTDSGKNTGNERPPLHKLEPPMRGQHRRPIILKLIIEVVNSTVNWIHFKFRWIFLTSRITDYQTLAKARNYDKTPCFSKEGSVQCSRLQFFLKELKQ